MTGAPGKETVGFIGIGKMGWPMAANLVRAGYTVLPWDTDAGQRATLRRRVRDRQPGTDRRARGGARDRHHAAHRADRARRR